MSNRASVPLPNRASSTPSAGVWSKCPASSAPPKPQSRRTARHHQTSWLKCWWTPPPCPGRRPARGLANRTAGPSQPGPWWRMVDEWLGWVWICAEYLQMFQRLDRKMRRMCIWFISLCLDLHVTPCYRVSAGLRLKLLLFGLHFPVIWWLRLSPVSHVHP